MSRQHVIAATAASFLAVFASSAWAQTRDLTSVNPEVTARARVEAVNKAAAPLIAAEKARPRIAGYWQISAPIKALTTVDGKAPPLNAEGKKIYKQRAADMKAGKNPDPMDVCLPPGTPRSLLVNKPFLIAQTPIKVTFFHQVYHVIRHVYLDGPLKLDPNDLQNLWEGQSSGRWEGDTLIIESGDFNGKQWLDDSGLPQSPGMLVTERIRKVDANTLEDVITYTDPKYYSAPWTARVTFRALPSTLLVEEDCAEKLLEFPMKAYAPE